MTTPRSSESGVPDSSPAAATTSERDEAVAAVAASLGLTLRASRRLQGESLGDGFVTGHEVELESPDGTVQTQTLYLDDGATMEERPGVLRLESESGAALSVWLYPADPALPALPAAVFPAAAAMLLSRLGLDDTDLSLEVLAYRPGKRAVVRMSTATHTTYLKVVRPHVVATLRGLYGSWTDAGIPVPRVVASASDGLVAFAPLPGVEATMVLDALSRGERFLDALDSLTRHIGGIPIQESARASLLSRLDWYERRLIAMDSDLAAGISRAIREIELVRDRSAPLPHPVTIHGDLHLGQIFVDPAEPTRISGVLDIDTAGLGDPADDAGAMYAHLIATAHHRESTGGGPGQNEAQRARMLAELLRARWNRADDAGFPDRALAVSAVQLLGHALAGNLTVDLALALVDETLAARPHR